MAEIDLQDHHLQQENRRLRRAVGELAILNELALEIGASTDSDEIMRSIVSRSIRSVEAEQADITLVERDEHNPAKTLVRSMESSDKYLPIHLNQSLLGWMLLNKKPLLINDPHRDPRFRDMNWERSIRSILSAPMMAKSKPIGVLTVYNKKTEDGFNDEDKRLLSIIASQSSQIVENARLHEEEQALIKMRNEVQLAALIQKRLLPNTPPEVEGYQLGGKSITAQAVGGDYFDFIKVDDKRWAIALGDVSGKGLPASLLMSNLQAILRGQVLHDLPPEKLLHFSNELLYRSTDAEKFATLFLGILDAAEHTFTYSSAGHEYPFLMRSNGAVEQLMMGGLPLGMFPAQEYEQTIVELGRGDQIVIYSDGVTDNTNEYGEAYGQDRLRELIARKSATKNGQHLLEDVVYSSVNFGSKNERFDDITAVVVSRHR